MSGSVVNDEASVIAIDIGGGTTKLAPHQPARRSSRLSKSFPTAGESGAAFLQEVVGACHQLRAEATAPVVGVSAAVARVVEVPTERSNTTQISRGWKVYLIAAILTDELGVRIHADADSNAACLAEYLMGEGQGSCRFLCLTGGTGLGVGMVVDGKLLRIAHGCMGDAGHVIVSPEGPACTCGGRGCAEALLSTAALGKRYSGINGDENVGFRSLVEDARAGKPAAFELLEEAGYWLGIAAASLASIFLPDRIAVAGGLSQAGDAFLGAAQSSFHAHAGRLPLARASLVRASTGEHATLLGAAAGFFNPGLL